MSKRLWLVCGLTETLTCRLIHERLFKDEPAQDVLVHYGRTLSVPSHLRRETLTTTRRSGPWSDVVDFCEKSEQISSMQSPQEAEARAMLLGTFGEQVSEIVTHTIDKTFERLVLQTWPSAKIVLYDNGLATHTDRQISFAASPWRPNNQVYVGDIGRVRIAFLTFRDALPVPNYLRYVDVQKFDRSSVIDLLRRMTSELPQEWSDLSISAPTQPRNHLILGTAFYRTNAISYDAEREIYKVFIDSLLESSSDRILFKEHPRANERPFFQRSDRLLLLDTVLPVEMVPLVANVASASSISSTALLYLNWLYGTPITLLPAPPELIAKNKYVRLLHGAVANGGTQSSPRASELQN